MTNLYTDEQRERILRSLPGGGQKPSTACYTYAVTPLSLTSTPPLT